MVLENRSFPAHSSTDARKADISRAKTTVTPTKPTAAIAAGSHVLNLDSITHPPYRLYVVAPAAELLTQLRDLHVYSAFVGGTLEHAPPILRPSKSIPSVTGSPLLKTAFTRARRTFLSNGFVT